MNDQIIDLKLEQANKDKASIEANIIELLKQKVVLQRKWIAAVNDAGDGRLILNLSALTANAKNQLAAALKTEQSAVSFCRNGNCGTTMSSEGLHYYNGKTEIIFGGNC